MILDYLVCKLPAEGVQAHLGDDKEFLDKFIKKFNRHGITFQVPPRVVTDLIESLFFVGIHRHDLGEDAYMECTDILADLVAGHSAEGAT